MELPRKSSSRPSAGSLERDSQASPFERLRRETERLFDAFSRDWLVSHSEDGNGFVPPRVDIAETEAGLEMTADLPGVKKEAIEIEVSDGVLTLNARHESEIKKNDEKKHYHLIERTAGMYRRRFELPFEADTGKIDAHFENGVLRVHVPRSPNAKTNRRTIPVH
jgi:HSP20 family protein